MPQDDYDLYDIHDHAYSVAIEDAMASRYTDILLCKGCGEPYFDDEFCENCTECEACGDMVDHDDLDPEFLLLQSMEVCKACTLQWRSHQSEAKDKCEIVVYKGETKPSMADFNGE